MGRWVAVEDVASTVPLPRYDVSLFYWWPGREFEKPEDLPERFRHLIRRSEKGGSLYLVYAAVEVPELERVSVTIPGVGAVEGPYLDGYSRCMEIDQKLLRKAHGRNAALGRLRQKLSHLGWTLVEVSD